MKMDTCDLCGGSDFKEDVRFDNWRLIECNSCGLKRSDPKPDKRTCGQLYDRTYFHSHRPRSLGYSSYTNQYKFKIRTFDSWFRRIEMFKRPGTCLDVGCAFGYSIEVSAARGWYTSGIDVSAYALERVTRAGLRAIHGDFLELTAKENYDLITAWDTIEHVTSPRLFFKQAYRNLKDGGILALTTPDCGAIVCHLWGKKWFEYKWPEHVFYLSRETLRRYCEEFGFEVVVLRPAIKFKPLPDVIARWLGLYESKRLLHSIFGRLAVPYSSLSEVFLIARKIP